MDYAGEDFRQVLKHEIYELGKNMNVGSSPGKENWT
jgi:hypothetical protein